MKISIYKNWKQKKGKGIEIQLKPFEFHFENKKKTTGFNAFGRNRIVPKSKYRGFHIGIYFKDRTCYWIELTVLNFIMSLSIDKKSWLKQFRAWKEKEGIT